MLLQVHAKAGMMQGAGLLTMRTQAAARATDGSLPSRD